MIRGLYQNLFDNPILTRELRRRMRGKALIASIILYIAIMAITTILILLASFNPLAFGQESTAGQLARMTETGQRLFMGIFVIQALLVLIIAPTITAGMTTAEKEKKTFDFLRVTTITPWMYILGCFLSTTFYVGLALLCALPLISLAFLYGGVGREDVVRLAVQLLTTSMVLSAFGLLISSLRERTRTAQGIVVFVIFACLFGGAILFQRLSVWLGLGGGGALPVAGPGAAPAAAPAAAPGIVILGMPIDPFVIGVAFSLFLTAVLLMMATRKLFDSDESRALSHWQFGVIAILVAGVQLAFASGQPLSNITYLLFMSLGCMMLLTAVFCFAVGRMEVGDEIWHLKRLFPILRPFDQTIPFLVIVGLGWWYAAGLLSRTVAGFGPLNPGAIQAAALSVLLVYMFLCVFARFATAVAVGRRGASRLTFAMTMVVLFGTLIVGALLALLFVETSAHTNPLTRELIRMSPIGLMIEAINTPETFTSNPLQALMVPGVIYGVLTVFFLGLGEYKRFLRWRGFDYHYDMPSR